MNKKKNIVIMAGPGSGKTTKILSMINELQETTPMATIVAITFTNKMAEELAGANCKSSTIHSWALNSIIYPYIGYTTKSRYNFANNEQRNYFKQTLRKDERDLFDYFINNPNMKMQSNSLKKIIKKWEFFKRENYIFDVEDILDMALLIAEQVRLRLDYDYFFVDEIQDQDEKQYQLFDYVNAQKVFVGDPNQSIYRFTGAIECFPLYAEREDFEIVKMEISYRCPQNFLDFSTRYQLTNLELKSSQTSDGYLRSIHASSRFMEEMQKEKDWKEYVYLTRTNKESNELKRRYGVDAMTIHKAKGLTIPKVALLLTSNEDLIDFNALAYVGITRASEKLCYHISHKKRKG